MADTDSEDFDLTRREFIVATTTTGVLASLPAVAKTGKLPEHPPLAPTIPPQLLDVTLKVNGESHKIKIDSRETLLDTVREKLSLTGSKKGCDHGQCGACTMLVNGQRINSCLSLTAQNQGKEVTTIEGLEKDGKLHPLQQAFIERDAFQCGFCTPGQIMSGVALLKENVGSSDADIREAMSGNICRCGAYCNILDAIKDIRKGGGHATV